MVEEAAVFRGKDGLDDMIRQLIDRYGAAMQDAALANFVAIAIKEGHCEIVACPPVLFCLVEGGDGQRQHDARNRQCPR